MTKSRNAAEPGRLDPGSMPAGEVSPTADDVDRTRAVGIARVSTLKQAEKGASLEAQTDRIRALCVLQGLELVEVIPEAFTGKTTRRPGLERALGLIGRGEASVLVATKVDRVSRSVADFAQLLARSDREGWRLVIVELGLDTATSHGRFAAHIMAAVAQLEREMIGDRTREALAVRRAAGVRLGRRSTLPADVIDRIRARRGEGVSLQGIADELNRDGVVTGQGAAGWQPSSVRSVLMRPV